MTVFRLLQWGFKMITKCKVMSIQQCSNWRKRTFSHLNSLTVEKENDLQYLPHGGRSLALKIALNYIIMFVS